MQIARAWQCSLEKVALPISFPPFGLSAKLGITQGFLCTLRDHSMVGSLSCKESQLCPQLQLNQLISPLCLLHHFYSLQNAQQNPQYPNEIMLHKLC